MSLGTGALKVSGKGPFENQAPQGGVGGIPGNPHGGTTPKQPLTGTGIPEHGCVEKNTDITRYFMPPQQRSLGTGRVGLNESAVICKNGPQ